VLNYEEFLLDIILFLSSLEFSWKEPSSTLALSGTKD